MWSSHKLRVFIFYAGRSMNAATAPRQWLISPDTAGIGLLSFLQAITVLDTACVFLVAAGRRARYVHLLLVLATVYIIFHLYNQRTLLARGQWRAIRQEFGSIDANDRCFSGVCILLVEMIGFAAFAYMGSILDHIPP
jgi:hypothetical protein